MGIWDSIKSGIGYTVEAGTLGAYNPVNKSGWLSGPLNSVLGGPQQGSTAAAEAAQANAQQLQAMYGGRADAFAGKYLPGSDAALAGNTANQNANIAMLQKYATGQMPSPAELMLKQQGANNAANSYATAAALGGRTPGATLDSALRSANAANATAGQQAGVQRAADQANATSALTQALGQQQSGLTTQRGQTLGNIQSLYGNELGAGNQVVGAAGGITNANVANAASNNAYAGGLTSGIAQGLATGAKTTSDEREKTDVHSVGPGAFDKLAEALKGFTFEYKHPGEVAGETAGPHTGVLAQDALQGGPAGRGMVSQGSDGVLRLDNGKMLGAALAMSAEALRRSKKPGGSALDGAFARAA